MILSSTSTGICGKNGLLPLEAIYAKKCAQKLHSKIQFRSIVTTPNSILRNIYPESGHIIRVRPNFKHLSIPTSSEWTRPSAIKVVVKHPTTILQTSTKVHYFAGGFPALMQAVYKLNELGPESSEQVVYVNDGKIPKSIQSGHQGHVHPTEWASEDCYIPNLFKTMLQGLGVLNPTDPNDLNKYSYLHFPISGMEVLKNPKKFIKLYGSFFKQRLKQNFTSVNGVSKLDRWLCDGIRKSLKFHQELSDKIEAKTGCPTFKHGFRIYCSTDLKKIEKKKRVWEELDIPCEMMSKKEIMEHTLLKADKNHHALKIHGDGNFYPETPQRIIDYMQEEFPNFTVRVAKLKELRVDEASDPTSVLEVDPQTKKETVLPITSFFCSPGHNEVYKVDKIAQTETRLWEETPVSGVSTLWECKISVKEIEKRFGKKLNENDLINCSQKLVASANLSNLHITPVSAEISPDGTTVVHIIRGTQGANFNKTVADINDLRNMCANLNEYYIGDWDLLSVGTCTRKTGVKNAPETSMGFWFNHSGIGYSASAMPPDSLRHPYATKE
ncbi:MAG TPA: hypothetical protein VGP47_05200 [Parachlamydiaceae bacterium]|nr:hypothetical protein [Parachlamydiaceae bacterium]